MVMMMARRLLLAAAAALLLPAVASAQGIDGFDGVLAYPAEEHRISYTCFTATGDEFTCGWYCAQAFYVATDASTGAVTLTPFGEGNLEDAAACSDCSLFEGTGMVPNGDLTASGAIATGYLNGGYKWAAVYDAANEEVLVNFTDYDEPCEIRYFVTAGDVMGVPPAPGRPLKADGQATLELTGVGGGREICDTTLEGCTTWEVRVSADVSDWQNLDEAAAQGLECPARVEVWSVSNDEFTGHDGVPRGSDGALTGADSVTATRNTIVSWSPLDLVRCEQYFTVTAGCFDGEGPGCAAAAAGARHSMAYVRAHVAEVRARRARNQRLRAARGAAHQQQFALSAADVAAAGAYEWTGAPGRRGWWHSAWLNPLGVDPRAAAALWGLALALAAAWARSKWAARAAGKGEYAPVPDGPEARRPLLAAAAAGRV